MPSAEDFFLTFTVYMTYAMVWKMTSMCNKYLFESAESGRLDGVSAHVFCMAGWLPMRCCCFYHPNQNVQFPTPPVLKAILLLSRKITEWSECYHKFVR